MPAQPASVLLVDDDDITRDTVRDFLEGHGFTVACAAEGSQALAQLERACPDLVLLDVVMDGLSGLDILRQVRQSRPATELPIIMATARDQGQDVVEALRLGANDYVTKPFDMRVVLARVQNALALKHSVDRIMRLEQSLAQQNVALQDANRRMKRDLETAARVQLALLPREMPDLPDLTFAQQFRPSTELAGDLLNVVTLPDGRIALYVLDVSSHGAAAALLAVMVNRVLARYQPESPLIAPSQELARLTAQLGQEFPHDPQTEQYFTLQYGLLDPAAYTFRFVSAGHPGPAYLPRNQPARNWKVPGVPIGWLDRDEAAHVTYTETTVTLAPGDRLFLYSDGLLDALDANDRAFGVQRLLDLIDSTRDQPLAESLATILHAVEQWSSPLAPHDDITILAVERTG